MAATHSHEQVRKIANENSLPDLLCVDLINYKLL